MEAVVEVVVLLIMVVVVVVVELRGVVLTPQKDIFLLEMVIKLLNSYISF